MKQTLDNLDTGLEFRTKLNDNFTELYDTPIIPEGDPVNAVAAGFVATIVSRPDDYVKNINSSTTLTVVTQPNINVQSYGTITVTGTPVAEETFVVYGQTFTFKAARTGVGEVTIDADNNAQATNIAAAIAADVAEVTAVDSTNTVLVTAVEAAPFIGSGGDVIVFTESATGIAVSGTGTLTNGVDADTIIVDASTFTFIANGTIPEADEIALGANVDATATAIADKLASVATITAVDSTNTVVITAVVDGIAGDGITVTVDGVRLTGGPVTAGGQDEVLSYIEVNGINYIFSDVAGDDPTVEYPNAVKVATAAGATTTQIAAAWVTALKLDASVFSATSVSNADNIVSGSHKDGGETGTEVTYTNHLITAGDITVTGVVDGTFSGDVNGTPGYKGQIFLAAAGTHVYVCTATDLTSTNDNWKKLVLVNL